MRAWPCLPMCGALFNRCVCLCICVNCECVGITCRRSDCGAKNIARVGQPMIIGCMYEYENDNNGRAICLQYEYGLRYFYFRLESTFILSACFSILPIFHQFPRQSSRRQLSRGICVSYELERVDAEYFGNLGKKMLCRQIWLVRFLCAKIYEIF